MELAHNGMRSTLNNTNGKGMAFEAVAMMHLGSAIAASHAYDQAPVVAPVRGRPVKHPKPSKFNGWNAYVQHHKPGPNGQEAIRDGSYLAALGAKWKAFPAEEKAMYENYAAREKRRQEYAVAAAQGVERGEAANTTGGSGPWAWG